MLGLGLIDEEFTEIQVAGLASSNFDLRHICLDSVVDLVSFALNVEDEWTSLTLDVALQVVVVCELILGVELNFNWQVRERRDYS